MKNPKQKRNEQDIKGVEREVMDVCRASQRACDSNTELCIEFWETKKWERLESSEVYYFADVIRKYPPESLTKYRRNLIFDGLITPSDESKKHSQEMEQQNHIPQHLWDIVFNNNNSNL